MSDIQSFFEEKKQNSESDRVGYFFKYVNSLKINNENNCINNYVLNRSLIKISSNYLGLLPVFCGGSLMENFPHKGARISSQLWHRDKHDRKIIKIFLYLTDVDSKNGPFEYITKTHVNGKFWKKFRTIERLTDSELKGKNSEILSYKKICTGKAGDIIFVDTTGIHRGGYVQKGRRKIVECCGSFFGRSHCLWNRSGDHCNPGHLSRYTSQAAHGGWCPRFGRETSFPFNGKCK